MEKYYTPEPEEFHKGFEYQYKPRERNGVIAHINNNYTYVGKFEDDVFRGSKELTLNDKLKIGFYFTPKDLGDVEQFIKDKAIRVKYLDGSQMSELGIKLESNWVPKKHKERYCVYGIMKTEFRGGSSEFRFIYRTTNKWMLITIEDKTVFAGFIKNKSELDKILKMIKT